MDIVRFLDKDQLHRAIISLTRKAAGHCLDRNFDALNLQI